jgi:PAS domain S-box-containing protein
MDQKDHLMAPPDISHDASYDQRLFSRLVEQSSDVMCRLDRALRFIYVNPAVTRWTGLAPNGFQGKTGVEAGLRASVWQLLAEQCRIAFDTGTDARLEFSDDTPQGLRRFAARFVPEFDSSRQVETLIGIVVDITEQWRAQAALQEKDEVLALAEVAGNLGRCDWHVPSGTLTLSPRMQAIYGVASFDGRYESWMRLIHPLDLDRLRSSVASVFERHETSFRVQYRVVRPDHGILWIEAHYSVSYDDAGHPLRVISENADITLHKDVEQRLTEANEHLQRASMNQARLLEAERSRIAGNLHDGVGQLLYLAGIKLAGAMNLVADKSLRGALEEVAGVIGQATRDIRSIEFELSPPQLRQFGLMPALAWLVDDMARQFGVQVTVSDDNLDKPLSPFLSAVLYRAVRELLINVAKHAQVDTARVAVRRAGIVIEITVSDGGVGLMGRDTVNFSSGLGLRAVREALISSGGDISIVSPKEGGTLATLMVPLLLTADVATEAQILTPRD